MKIYVLVDTKDADKLTAEILQKGAEKYGVYKSEAEAFNALEDIEDARGMSWDALLPVEIH